ncbi:hypothetical protein EVG20_g41 [Dentipellis fragilis]|uniref:RING-type domain-containing protein n=1 Tax=Dentipellis fragilis TaxID=205917 RepID=A0A4Y9ZDU1_9AGAM|nr:hypothetical protein EVG20_g41 [Dentipellis fragilis]
MASFEPNGVEDYAITAAISNLPVLTPEEVSNLDEFCPICLMTFRSAFEAEATAGPSTKGVTKVEGCGHMFCTEDLAEWIRCRHGTCPTCRYPFLPEIQPVDSDDEESDGGEYVPTEYDADTDFDTDFEDGFMDSDGLDVETMDVETEDAPAAEEVGRRSTYGDRIEEDECLEGNTAEGSQADREWWDEAEEDARDWGLTDGDSMSASEGGLSLAGSSRLNEGIQIRLSPEGEYSVEDEDKKS